MKRTGRNNKNKRESKMLMSSRGRGGRRRVPRFVFQQSGWQWVRLGGWYEVATSGGGVIAGVVPADPTLINNGTIHPEYTAWSSLYGEIIVDSLTVRFFPRFAESKSVSTDGTPLAIAGSTNVSSPPASLDVVLDNASSRSWNFLNDASSSGFRYELRYPWLNYLASASPGGTTGSGTPGGVGFYGLGYAASTFGVHIQYSAVYRMRNRI